MECLVLTLIVALVGTAVYFQRRLDQISRKATFEIDTLKAQVRYLYGRLELLPEELPPALRVDETQPAPLLPPPAPETPLPIPASPPVAAPPKPAPAPHPALVPPKPIQMPKPAPAQPQPAAPVLAAKPAPLPAAAKPAAPMPPRNTTLDDMAASMRSQFGRASTENPLLRWFFSAHLIVRVGIVILFIGIAFLLRYAADQGWLPVELRLLGAGVLGAGLVGIGWRLRTQRRVYALTLQGGGLGIVYLTIFVAYRLYALLPAAIAFPALVVLGGLAAGLAVLTNAMSLALLAMAGAFAAPLLVDTGSDNVVAFFAYLTVVNAAILAIAWFRAWRVLNLVGFVATTLLGTLWGLDAYTPAHLTQVQPFVGGFLVFYVVLGLLFASRQPPKLLGLVDGPLVVVTPIVFVGWQTAMLQGIPYGLAIALAAMGAFYLVLAAVLTTWSPPHFAGLREAYLVIGTLGLTLAVPLGFDDRSTVALWAVGGAGLIALGLRQSRLFHVGWGLAMQLYAGYVHGLLVNVDWLGVTRTYVTGDVSVPPLTHTVWIGSMLLVLAGVVTAYLFLRRARTADDVRRLAVWRVGHTALLVWALGWWYVGSAHEVGRLLAVRGPLAENQVWTQGLLALLVGSAVLGELLNRWVKWPMFRLPAQLLWVPAVVIGVQLQQERLLLIDTWTALALWTAVILIHLLSFRRDDPLVPHGVVQHLGLAILTTVLIWSMELTPGVVVYALGGAALAIAGMRRQQHFRIGWGLAMQFFAGWLQMNVIWDWLATNHRVAWVWGWSDPLAIGYVALTAAWFATAYVALRQIRRAPQPVFWSVHVLATLVGLGWWYLLVGDALLRGAGELATRIGLVVSDQLLIVILVSGILGEVLASRLHWPLLRIPSVASLIPLGLVALYAAWESAFMFAGWGLLLWPATIALYYVGIYRLERDQILPVFAPILQLAGLWTLAAIGTLELMMRVWEWDGAASGWSAAALAAVPALLVLLVSRGSRWFAWPFRRHEGALVEVGALVLTLILVFWMLTVSLVEAGNSAPWAYRPVVNPVDLTQLLVLAALGAWMLQMRARGSQLLPASAIWVIFPIFALVTVNAILARFAYHQWGTEFAVSGWLDDALLQAAYSVIWSVAALTCMVTAARTARRPLWLLGASLLGLTVVKLLLLDMSGADTLARIVSFIVVGLLMLLVGYVAPIPPRPGQKGPTGSSPGSTPA